MGLPYRPLRALRLPIPNTEAFAVAGPFGVEQAAALGMEPSRHVRHPLPRSEQEEMGHGVTRPFFCAARRTAVLAAS
jgi:hypothetical protein